METQDTCNIVDQLFATKGIILPSDKNKYKELITNKMVHANGNILHNNSSQEDIVYDYLVSNYAEEVHAILTPMKTLSKNGQILKSLTRFNRYALYRLVDNVYNIKRSSYLDYGEQEKMAVKVKELPSVEELLILEFNMFKLLRYKEKYYSPIGIDKPTAEKFFNKFGLTNRNITKYVVEYIEVRNSDELIEALNTLHRALQRIFASDNEVAYKLRRPIIDATSVRHTKDLSTILDNVIEDYCKLLRIFEFKLGELPIPKGAQISILASNATELPVLLERQRLGVCRGRYYFPGIVVNEVGELDLEYKKITTTYLLYKHVFESYELLKDKVFEERTEDSTVVIDDVNNIPAISSKTLMTLKNTVRNILSKRVPIAKIINDAIDLDDVPDDRNIYRLVEETKYCVCKVNDKYYAPSKIIKKGNRFTIRYSIVKSIEAYNTIMISLMTTLNEMSDDDYYAELKSALEGKLPSYYIEECISKGTLLEVASTLFPDIAAKFNSR